jgi:hypothetical protein
MPTVMNSSSTVLRNSDNKAEKGVPSEDAVDVNDNLDSDGELIPDPHYDDKYKGKKKLKMHSEDFEANLGKVIDTLNQDYPVLFEKAPDFSIYIDEIEITDPTGKAFQGLPTYKSLWTFLRWSNKTVFK